MAKGLGWRPDVPDIRDEKFAFRVALRPELVSAGNLPPRTLVPWRYNKRRNRPVSEYQVHDQGQSSSCTGQSTETMISLQSGWTPRSRNQLYWSGREEIGETNVDNGAYIRDVVKKAVKVGAGSEALWPFATHLVTTKPSRQVMFSATRHKVLSYHRLQTRQDFLSCLAQGYAFVIGFMVYADFATSGGIVDRTGLLKYPDVNQADYGGHAVAVIGYDNDFHNSQWGRELIGMGLDVPKEVYIVRNSWGFEWGRNGDFAVDARYFENTNLADDAWTVRMTKNSS
jgi:C1A family cysteine protease